MTYKKIALSALVSIISLMGTAQAAQRGNQPQIEGRVQVAVQQNLHGQDALNLANDLAAGNRVSMWSNLTDSVGKGILGLGCLTAGAGSSYIYSSLAKESLLSKSAVLCSLGLYGAVTLANRAYKPTKRTTKEYIGKRVFEIIYYGLGIAAVGVGLALAKNVAGNSSPAISAHN